MPQPRGMRPPSLMALSIERPPSLNLQQPNPPEKELTEPSSLSHSDQNHPSFGDEVQKQRFPTQLNQGNNRSSQLQLCHSIERPPVPPEGPRPMSMQEFPRPPRPPVLPEGFRHPQLPNARQPLQFQGPRPSSPFSEDIRPPSLPMQNFQRPPTLFNSNMLKPSSMQEDQFPPRGHMLQVPISCPDDEMQKHHGVQTPTNLQRQTSGETQQNVAAIRDLSDSSSTPQEEMHQFPQSLKPIRPSVMGKVQDDESGHHRQMSSPHQNAGAPPPLRFRPDLPRPPPIPQPRGPPSLMDLNFHRAPFPPPVRPALPLPTASGNSDSVAAPDVGSDSQQPLSAQQRLVHGSSSLSVSDSQCSAANYQVGMSNEPLQFTSRMPLRSTDNSFQRDHPPRMSKPGVFPPISSSLVPLPGTGNQPLGMSDEPLQFTGRMPPPRLQDPSVLQRLPSSNVRPLSTPQTSEDIHRMPGAANFSAYPLSLSDQPLQFTGRMAVPRMQDASPNLQPLGSNVRPGFSSVGVSMQPVGDKNQIQGASNYPAGMSDEPLQFAGRMPAPRIPDSLSYRQPQHLHDSGIRPLTSGQASVSAVVSTHVQALQPPVCPPLGMPPPPFIGIPPPRPLGPPQIGTRPHMGMPPSGPDTRLPPPLPSGPAVRPPLALPGSDMSHSLRTPAVAGPVMPRPPFFSPVPNVVS